LQSTPSIPLLLFTMPDIIDTKLLNMEACMNNVWIVAPVRDNSIDISSFINDLTGGFIVPETYEKENFNNQTMQIEAEIVSHPHFGKTVQDFTDKIVLVNSAENYTEYDGVTHVEDFGDINIARWINTGINTAIVNGATKVVVLSNPCSFDVSALIDGLAEAENKEVVNIGDGVMFILDGSSEFRLDEQFKIWFWADDFYRRVADVCGGARPEFINLTELIPYIVESQEDIAITKEDEIKYNAKWS
jgi:hypothetical protein